MARVENLKFFCFYFKFQLKWHHINSTNGHKQQVNITDDIHTSWIYFKKYLRVVNYKTKGHSFGCYYQKSKSMSLTINKILSCHFIFDQIILVKVKINLNSHIMYREMTKKSNHLQLYL